MAGAFPSLEEQIRARWGRYGDWNSADQNQAADLARLLEANGVTDLTRLQLAMREFERPAQQNALLRTSEGGDEYGDVAASKYTAPVFTYDGRDIGFLGDVNRDSSLNLRDEYKQHLGINGQENLAAWSAAGGGHTNFNIVPADDGGWAIAPVWESSKADDLYGAKMAALFAGIALSGGVLGGMGGTIGAAGTGAAQGAMAGMASSVLTGGDPLKGGFTGLVGGGLTGGIGAYGAEQGWNPAVTRAVTSGANTALRGGDGSDILTSMVTSGANGLTKQGHFTGDPNIDRAVVQGGSTLLRGGSLQDAVIGGGMSYLNNSLRSGANSFAGSNATDMQLDPSVLAYDTDKGNTAMDFGDYNWDTGSGGDSGSDIFGGDDPFADLDLGGSFTNDSAFTDTGTGYTDEQTGTYDPGADNRTGVRGADGYGNEGMTGDQTAVFDKVLAATGSNDLAARLASNPTIASVLTSMTANGVRSFLGSDMGKLLLSGAMATQIGNAKVAPNDPALQRSMDQMNYLGQTAIDRATNNDAYFRDVIQPEYINMVRQGYAQGQRGYDMNMNAAREAAAQRNKFYQGVDELNSEDYQDQQAGRAMATARQTNEANRGMAQRRMFGMGINPNSGAYGAMLGQMGSRSALNEMMAANMTRQAMKDQGLKYRGQAASMVGADAQYSNNALNAANFGRTGLNTAVDAWNKNNSQWNTTMGGAKDAFGQLGNWGMDATKSQTAVNIANQAGKNELAGYAIGKTLWG